MMNSRKNLALALFLGLALAGCKTVQTNQVADNDAADRVIAANVSPLLDALTKARTVEEKAALLKKINLYKDEAVKKFGRITEQNIAEFDAKNREISERILNALSRSTDFRGVFTRPEYVKLLKDVETAKQLRQAAGNLGDARVAGRTSGPVISGPNGNTVGAGLDRMEFLAELRGKPEFKTPEGSRALDELTQSENEVRRNTGRSWFNRENCNSIDAEGAKAYKRMIDDVNAEYKKTGKLCPELEAYVLLRFQATQLTKSPAGAYRAIIGARKCKFAPPGVVEAVEKMGASNMRNGQPQIPDRAPACN